MVTMIEGAALAAFVVSVTVASVYLPLNGIMFFLGRRNR